MKIFGLNIIISKAVKNVALSQVATAAAALKATSIGSAVAADVKALTSKDLTGAQKFATVLAKTTPLLVDLLTSSGRKAAVAEVEDVARELVQSTYNDVASSTAGTAARLILDLLKKR